MDNPATTEQTMQAIAQDGYGSADVLRLRRLPRPTISDDQVLVHVHAAGLDRGTWHLMTGLPYLVRLMFGLRRPRQPVAGRGLSGTVVAVGSAVTRFSAGDEVYGTGEGSFAEYAAARADRLAPRPPGLSWEEAATVPISAPTALWALTDAGRLRAGQKVLVTGASGGVGSFAVALAKALGAEVTGVCRTTKRDLVRSLGADHVIDHTSDDFADGRHHYDLIIDVGGNPSISRLRRALAPTGTAVITGGEGGGRLAGGIDRQLRAMALSPFIRQRFTTFISSERASELERLSPFFEAGSVRPAIDRTYPLAEAPQAMRRLEAGEVRGKLAITVRQG